MNDGYAQTGAGSAAADPDEGGAAEYGPAGYLPERAAKRARKLVLRQPMGLGWPAAAVIAALVLLVTGIVYGAVLGRPPGDGWVRLVPEATIPENTVLRVPVDDGHVLLLRSGGATLAFAASAEDVVFCRSSRRLESRTLAAVWNLNGRLVGGKDVGSLVPLRTRRYDGDLYVNAGQPLPPRSPQPRGETVECR